MRLPFSAFSFISSTLFVCFTSISFAGPFDAPPTYYNSATGTGSTLKNQLHNIIDDHTVFSYGDARTILQDTDVDPNDSDNIILVYNRVSLDLSNIGGSIPGWDSGSSWNREHTWPRSLGVNSSGPDNSDLHQLRPSNPSVNSARGNLDFGGIYGAQGFGSVNDGGTKWYPGDAEAGMIARQQFYMAVRYDGSDSSTEDLELDGSNTNGQLGNLDRLIEWHYEAVADDFELRRNDVIYDDYQGNRNPFVDHPEFVWSVFVDQQNDSRIGLAGTSVGSNGASTLNVDLGSVYVNGSTPSNQNVTINKNGNDGTYYEVTTSGSATSSIEGRYNAFRSSGTDSETISVGLSITTSTPGQKTGQVTIDNLDITTSGGTGRGANDANDVINLSYDVFSHPDASFSGSSLLTSTTIDFGTITEGTGTQSLPFSLFNFGGIGAPVYASNLELDSIIGSGSTGVLTTNASTFVGLDQGNDLDFLAMLDTSNVGSFSATYQFNLSGEDLPGDQNQVLTLNLIGEIEAAGLAGDYNGDNVVNAADYTVWRDTLGSTSMLDADGDGSGTIDAGDYTVWTTNFGMSIPTTATAVPEPSSIVMLTFTCLLSLGSSRRS